MRLQVLGSINLDVVTQVQSLPRPGDTVLALHTTEGAGGKGANQARAAARFGARVFMHGAVGDDAAGRTLRAGLEGEGVDVSGVKIETDAPTGRAHVMVSAEGENMIVVDAGANRLARFTPSDALEPSIFLTQLETPVAAAVALFQTRRFGDLCILNAAPAILEGRALMPLADLIVLNEGELAVYAGVEAALEGDIAALARALITRDGQHVIVTLGPAGAVIVGPETMERIEGRAVTVVDTTGAGDCFVGVLAGALADGATLTAAATLANLAASIAVQTLGADAAPTRARLDALAV